MNTFRSIGCVVVLVLLTCVACQQADPEDTPVACTDRLDNDADDLVDCDDPDCSSAINCSSIKREATCGDGFVTSPERCDTAISAEDSGSCPISCTSNDACTPMVIVGEGCSARCESGAPITACVGGDGCCPAGCSSEQDDDCSATCGDGKLDDKESCDTKIPAGELGACPTTCDDQNACTDDRVAGSGCDASCPLSPITRCADGDGCCPGGCNHDNDSDCSPSCGNGTVDANESCDTLIAAGQPGACPESCDDENACTQDSLLNAKSCSASCQHRPIAACRGGDGCCPSGCNAAIDSDCSPTCGNGVIEAKERCDTKIPPGKAGTCPTDCDDGNSCTRDALLNAGSCGASCTNTAITLCSSGDGCCPSGCDANRDSDCSPTCGNGVLEAKERCDTKIVAGQPGACPARCDDANACTKDALLNGGTCGAICAASAISKCTNGDGCCPAGCNAINDGDCSPSCGNGVIEAPERCDIKIPAGKKGTCPASCNDNNACTRDSLLNGGTCGAICQFTKITRCSTVSDGCCAAGCNANNDVDCKPVCGNGALEKGERCDPKIPLGKKGACPTSCDDGKLCTNDRLIDKGTCQARCSSAPKLCLSKLDPCKVTACNPENGACETRAKCDDRNRCTKDTCRAGVCSNTAISCDDGNRCTRDSCIISTGQCAHLPICISPKL